MLRNDNTEVREVRVLTASQREFIKSYLQGAVYCWCNTKGEEWFAARDFLGGDNYFWESTPVCVLYDHFMQSSDEDHDYAFNEAAKSAGRLLKQVHAEDARTFDT